MMKLAAVCCTYCRPIELANAIECFLRQDYPADRREMIVLGDAGQYSPAALDSVPGVKLVTTRHRFRTLGEKRNACAALASPDVDAYCVWDDDDVYLPHHMSAAAAALEANDYTVPTALYTLTRGHLELKTNQCMFHGSWSYRRDAFETARGYPWIQSGQDQGLMERLRGARLRRGDPVAYDPRPSYIYRWFSTPSLWHLSHVSADGGSYESLANQPRKPVAEIVPAWERDWLALVADLEQGALRRKAWSQ